MSALIFWPTVQYTHCLCSCFYYFSYSSCSIPSSSSSFSSCFSSDAFHSLLLLHAALQLTPPGFHHTVNFSPLALADSLLSSAPSTPLANCCCSCYTLLFLPLPILIPLLFLNLHCSCSSCCCSHLFLIPPCFTSVMLLLILLLSFFSLYWSSYHIDLYISDISYWRTTSRQTKISQEVINWVYNI